MNNKSFYSIASFLAFFQLLLIKRDIGLWANTLSAILCGSALYFVLHNYRKHRGLSLVMTLYAVAVNPFYVLTNSFVGTLIVSLTGMVLFYLLAKRERL